MRYVPKLDRFSSCVMIPGRVSDDRGFIVGDGMIEGLHGDVVPAISIRAIRQSALRYPSETGLVDVGDLELAQQEIGDLEALLAATVVRAENLEARQDRIAGFARDGFKVQKVMGRPPKAEVDA